MSVPPCEFRNEVTGEVTIPSSWEKTRAVAESGTQTSPLKTKEQESQTAISSFSNGGSERHEVGVQTVGVDVGQASLVGLQYVYTNSASFSEEKLAAFLEAKREAVLAVLSRNAKSESVFEHYQPNWSSGATGLSTVLTLSSPHAVERHLHVLDVAWNASGTMVAVAYGRVDTSGWCYDTGFVCIWNLLRPDVDCQSPHYTIETDTYATAVAFHPRSSATLGIGTYSGAVIVCPNVADAVPQELSSAVGESAFQHEEPVTKLQWLRDSQESRESHQYLLCSSALDGQLMFWNPANKLAGPTGVLSVLNKHHVVAGVTGLAFSHSAQRQLAGGKDRSVPTANGAVRVGLESGEVGHGQTLLLVGADAAVATAATPLTLDWADAHSGPVQAISSSPFFRHLFATCSSDGSTRVYTDMEREPLLTLEPSSKPKHCLYAAQFSPFRPSVIAVASGSSSLFLYDLQALQARPLYAVEAGTDGSAVTAVAFNDAAAEWLATGDTCGCVRVWRLPSDLTQTTDRERAAVRLEQHAGGKDDATGGVAAEALRHLLGLSV